MFKNYKLTLAEQIELDKFLKENMEKGYIQPSKSLMASPFLFVSKKDGRLQACQDYWYLNDWTLKNSYPLPLISDIMDKLKGAKTSLKWMFDGDITISRFEKAMNGKQLLKPTKGCLNLPSCSWNVQLLSYIPIDDGENLWNYDWWKTGDHLHGQHPYFHWN